MDFESAGCYEDLLTANLRHLRGELLHSPFHDGPPAAETAPLLGALERLHTERGWLTFESQPGLLDESWEDMRPKECFLMHGGCREYREVQQRAYVDFWAPAPALPGLLVRLSNIACGAFFLVDAPGRTELFRHNVPEAAAWHDAGGGAHLSLTRERCGPSPAACRAAPWALRTNAALRPGFADAEIAAVQRGRPQLAAILRSCVLVGVMASGWGVPPPGQPSLLDILLRG